MPYLSPLTLSIDVLDDIYIYIIFVANTFFVVIYIFSRLYAKRERKLLRILRPKTVRRLLMDV